ncbi:cobalamin biosynthesis protein [Acidianus sulfidivorans JP7]|uniref:Probable cobalamin biosynthesis protein CobD n=1 Tax=Acidianus sulfidivorans JP7 TaxID=619593 RepID=A0A2U9INI1_9CREN|nr:cobalamin biosynthesis protein [Acidianus sulfidivorans]AWR97514.1 cobalamin biosynthesis protein [Acidianus sulfidivorans JP7]
MLPILFIALIIDLLFGEPPTYIHPVVLSGKISEKLIKPFAGYLYGIFLWIISVIPVEILYLLPLFIPEKNLFLIIIKIFVLSLILKTTFSIRMLYNIVNKAKYLDNNSRSLVQQIVRRDLSKADNGHIASAAIESLFESLVDGITSPLFWFLLFGLAGSLLQRLANTMDSMVGYKTNELYKEGYFSAKIDTILNYIPARITALFMLLSALLIHLNIRNGIKILKNSKMESINAKYPIAAAAGILNIKLEKIGYYTIGEGNLPTSEDIEKALKLFKITLMIYLLFISIIYYCFYGFALFSYPYGLIKFF